ncbi:IclR family transcriptional regulator [Stutzerimonas xanthomarina]|uniref:Transcriptional regulator, IclR family n=2 Tax=Stutzerimonas xanthomarina TaxID=271420 RepID=A0A1M5LEL5_9GAMM|nr:IclR family transcriptional regulator [Stutzerimonas xanthomarina]MCP9340737.1 IclR family transcriptional regulator [Stutzerimonas xanthomarina]SEH52869.1 transcriptional regulator, IclR family [Stutzerimonas xanthomarina]SHG63159.1 transcriptional regulator, IclR family [Stutzerimonas xanthomarina DSM 18231]
MSDIEDTDTPKDRKFVEALSRGLDVLRAFTHGSVVMGNQDIARITGLPKPTVSRMTYTLTKLGYLSYSPQLEKYQLDSGVLALGYAYVSNLRVRQLAKPYMDEFSRRTNTSVGLTCRDRLSMIYIENCRPAEVSTLRMDAGVRLPLATTAAGRAFLAGTPNKERAHLMAALEAKYGDEWATMEQSLEKSFAEFRQHGFCLSLGDWDRNVMAAGVPLHLADGSIMALTCGAPSFQLSEETLRGSLAHQLEMLARDIESLGV